MVCVLRQVLHFVLTIVAPAGSVICRAAQGECDVEERCTPSSTDCPPDQFAGAQTVCREAERGDCDASERCDGKSRFCPADAPKAAGSTCGKEDSRCFLCIQPLLLQMMVTVVLPVAIAAALTALAESAKAHWADVDVQVRSLATTATVAHTTHVWNQVRQSKQSSSV